MKKINLVTTVCFITVVACIGFSVYTKISNEKEQLVLAEVMAHLSKDEESAVKYQQLKLVKPKLFTSYEEWYVEVENTDLKYRYTNGEVRIMDVMD